MITITGWLWHRCGDTWLTLENPEDGDSDNAIIVAQGNEYQEGENKRSYLKNNSCINVSFWDHFTEDELDVLIDEEDDVSFEIVLLSSDVRTLIKSNNIEQESEHENNEDNEDEIKNNKQIVSKQKTEAFDSSLPSLI